MSVGARRLSRGGESPEPPTQADTPRIGIYDGTYHNTNLPDPDAHTQTWAGVLPPVASAYYNGNQLPAPSEDVRLSRGTHAVLDCGLRFPAGYANPVTIADLANQTPAGTAWINARVQRFHALSQVNPNAKVYVSLEQEWDIKIQRDVETTNAHLQGYTAQQYAAAMDTLFAAMHAGAPDVVTNYWSSGSISTISDRTNILAVLAAMTVPPKIMTIDPYRGKNRPSTETFLESAGPKIQWYRDNTDFQRLGSPPMAIAEVGTDRSHGDASVAAFINSIRPGLETLDLGFAIWFNRDSGPNNNCKIDGQGMPLSVVALANAFSAG